MSAFTKLLEDRPDLTQAAIARELGVSRQAVRLYLKGKAVPSQERLSLAVHKWGIKLKHDDVEFGVAAFEVPRKSTGKNAVQLDLFELAKRPADVEIPGSGVKLRVGTKGSGALEILVEFDPTAA